MAEIRVPVLGESIVEATVARWLKREGEQVAVGEPVVELETEKVNTEVPADEAGVLERLLHAEGDTVRPGDALATIAAIGPPAQPESPPPAHPESVEGGVGATTAAQPHPAAPPTIPSAPEDTLQQHEDDRVRVSPVAQRAAAELGVDLARLAGTGPGGRVTRDDVEAYTQRSATEAPAHPAEAPAQPEPPPPAQPEPVEGPIAPSADQRLETRQRLSRRRLTIARRLVEAQRTAAMLSTFNEVDMSAVIALRQRYRESFRERYGVSLGYMSFFTRAVIGALRAFPQVNAELQGEALVLKHYYDIGIAIGDPEGLVVPVLRDADQLTFAQIEQAIADLAQKARDKKLTLEDLQGGTFTITNGGVYGSLLSTPILNPPQVGILGMHKIEERPVVADGQVVVRPMMYLALGYDHRVVDGREAVQFLVHVKELVEAPERMLLEG